MFVFQPVFIHQSIHVQYTQTDTIRQTNGPLVPMVGLVCTNRKGFHSNGSIGVLATLRDSNTILCTNSQTLYTEGLVRLRRRYDSSNQWSIGTDGRIGTNRKGCHSSGSIVEDSTH